MKTNQTINNTYPAMAHGSDLPDPHKLFLFFCLCLKPSSPLKMTFCNSYTQAIKLIDLMPITHWCERHYCIYQYTFAFSVLQCTCVQKPTFPNFYFSILTSIIKRTQREGKGLFLLWW